MTAGRIAWITSYLAGLVRTLYTGRVTITLDFYQGGIRDARVNREEVVPVSKSA